MATTYSKNSIIEKVEKLKKIVNSYYYTEYINNIAVCNICNMILEKFIDNPERCIDKNLKHNEGIYLQYADQCKIIHEHKEKIKKWNTILGTVLCKKYGFNCEDTHLNRLITKETMKLSDELNKKFSSKIVKDGRTYNAINLQFFMIFLEDFVKDTSI